MTARRRFRCADAASIHSAAAAVGISCASGSYAGREQNAGRRERELLLHLFAVAEAPVPQQTAGALFRFVRDDALAFDAQYEVLLFAVAKDQAIEVVAPNVALRVRSRPNNLDGRMTFGDLTLERRLEDGILGGRLCATNCGLVVAVVMMVFQVGVVR